VHILLFPVRMDVLDCPRTAGKYLNEKFLDDKMGKCYCPIYAEARKYSENPPICVESKRQWPEA